MLPFLYGLHRIHKRPLDRRQVCLIYRGLQFLYVIDSVHQELLFRIDQKTARAKRYVPKDPAP